MAAGAGSRAHPRFAAYYPRIAAAADRRGAREHRRRLLAGLDGVVCEVGAGPGGTFAHYPPQVALVVAVEPEPTLRRRAADAAGQAPVPVRVLAGIAEALPLRDATCDAAVTSLALCSVTDPAAALGEVGRVLRPGGTLRFYEHVRSDRPVLARLEDAVTLVWRRFAAGCHPNRDTVAAIEAAGFRVTTVERFGFRPHWSLPGAAHVLGSATPAARTR